MVDEARAGFGPFSRVPAGTIMTQANGHAVGSNSSNELTLPAFRSASSRPQMALVPGSGPHLTSEVHALLRGRLRMATVIGLAGFAAFFLKTVVFRDGAMALQPLPLAFHAAVVAVLTMVCALLWTSIPLSTRVLRTLEIVSFGMMGAFFAFLQYDIYHGGGFTRLTNVDPVAAPENFREVAERMLPLVNMANAMRWYLLITLYGMFIPNTWKRCAVVVGAMVVTPLAVNFVTCIPCIVMGAHTWSITYDMTIVLALASATAIFGSYKINELQTEAYHARKLGQYHLKRLIGSGGMGEVYLGEHRLLRRACAIKVIRSEQAGDPTTLSRFEREVQAMATLTHWNTVEIFDYGRTEDGTFYYVMEYLPGLSLQNLVEQHGPLPAGRAIHFLRQLCAALREAHDIGLIHRDIKPSNIIASQRGGVHDVAKLLDFGLVQDIGIAGDDKLTMQGTILGSPAYISPEQARGRGQVDSRTDIYSLGGLAYFLVTGQMPFVRESVMEMIAAHLHETPTPPRQLRPELPSDLEEVILKCLSKSPQDRYGSVNSLDKALAQCECADAWDNDQAEQWWQQTASSEQPALV